MEICGKTVFHILIHADVHLHHGRHEAAALLAAPRQDCPASGPGGQPPCGPKPSGGCYRRG